MRRGVWMTILGWMVLAGASLAQPAELLDEVQTRPAEPATQPATAPAGRWRGPMAQPMFRPRGLAVPTAEHRTAAADYLLRQPAQATPEAPAPAYGPYQRLAEPGQLYGLMSPQTPPSPPQAMGRYQWLTEPGPPPGQADPQGQASPPVNPVLDMTSPDPQAQPAQTPPPIQRVPTRGGVPVTWAPGPGALTVVRPLPGRPRPEQRFPWDRPAAVAGPGDQYVYQPGDGQVRRLQWPSRVQGPIGQPYRGAYGPGDVPGGVYGPTMGRELLTGPRGGLYGPPGR